MCCWEYLIVALTICADDNSGNDDHEEVDHMLHVPGPSLQVAGPLYTVHHRGETVSSATLLLHLGGERHYNRKIPGGRGV